MTGHLLLVTLGPVQEFIAQARRTRDLWYGSHLLSELGRAAARALVEGKAELVFPALKREDSELVECLSPLRQDTQKPPLNIANKLLAEVPDGTDPRDLALAAREAVQKFWRDEIAEPVKEKCAGLLAPNIDASWNEQVDSFLEFAAAWAPLGEYAAARRAVEQALAARKGLRDFEPWEHQRGNVPKSSLDGARETVLRVPRERDAYLARKYRIGVGEQLDAVGLIKRAGGEPDQFVPIVNVALASWLELAERELPQQLDQVRRACEALKLATVKRELPCAKHFPYDASIILPSRWKSVFEEQLEGVPVKSDAWGRRHIQPLLDRMCEPSSYVACLFADGDRMGGAIEARKVDEEHRDLSRTLAGFAMEARRIVEQDHRGSLVYAGGDDVLAFLPLPEALACAETLRQSFARLMAETCSDLPEVERPTLSVGIGVGHIMEGMGDLLALGREAERLAKGAEHRNEGRDRNALAVIVDKRSGGTRSWRGRWDEWNGEGLGPAGRLQADAALLRERLSSRKVYQVERTLRRLPPPGTDGLNGPAWARLLALEVGRSLSRVQAGQGSEGGIEPGEVGLSLDESAGYAALHERVSAWIDRLLVARAFADATPSVRAPRQDRSEAA